MSETLENGGYKIIRARKDGEKNRAIGNCVPKPGISYAKSSFPVKKICDNVSFYLSFIITTLSGNTRHDIELFCNRVSSFLKSKYIKIGCDFKLVGLFRCISGLG